MRRLLIGSLPALLAACSSLGTSTEDAVLEPNPAIDYALFLETAMDAEELRDRRRLSVEQFAAAMAEPGVVVLDARSADKYALRHVRGAVSLPFTDFTAATLASVIPAKDTRVLIYCNNNFRGDEVAFATKGTATSLNISTFVSLVAYGYTGVHELGPTLDADTTALPMVTGPLHPRLTAAP